MALEQGELTIVITPNGAMIPMGTGSHTVSGPNAVKALQDAYGKRIGKVIDLNGSETIVNEYKENPKKEVNPSLLKDTGTVVKINSGEGAGQYAVKYSDGKYSYCGTGQEGLQEASRQYHSAKNHNEFIQDGRTRADFNTDQQYQDFLTVRSIRIGQGTYQKIGDVNGNVKLYAPNGAVVAEGNAQDVNKTYNQKTNELHLAMQSAERSQNFTSNEKQYIMQSQGLSTDEEFNQFVRNDMQKRQQALQSIYNSWATAANEQGILTEGTNWYQPELPDFTTFIPAVSQSDIPYEQWFSNLNKQQPEITTGVGTTQVSEPDETGTGTETTQVLDQFVDDTSTDETSVEQPPQVEIPDIIPYQPPAGYTPTFMDTTTGTSGTTFSPITGTFTKPAGTGLAGYTPTGITNMVQQDTTTTQLPTVSQPQNYEVRMFRNAAGMTTSITFIDGKPQTPIPSGFYPLSSQPQGVPTPQASQVSTPTIKPVQGYKPQFNMNQGGIVPPVPMPSGDKFGGFKPAAMQRIAQNLGYSGNMSGFNQYLANNPDKNQMMNKYTQRARQMANGGAVIKAQAGVDVTGAVQQQNTMYPELMDPIQPVGPLYADTTNTGAGLAQQDPRALTQQYIPQQSDYTGMNLTEVQTELAKTPGLPEGSTVVPVGTQITQDQLVDPSSGQVGLATNVPTTLATTEQAMMPQDGEAALMTPVEASGAISDALDESQAARLDSVAVIEAEQQEESSLSKLKAEQGTGIAMDNPVQREIQDGELVSGAANAEKASAFTEQIEAATAEPSTKATVAGQLEGLMAQFEGGNTPAWASGSMRAAMATLSARGLGASSLAGQAVIQAAMESALPIAQIDASTQASFESQNLSNRQQRAMLAAQQRASFMQQEFDQEFQARVVNAAKVSDVANMNFTAEQQIALENSRIANTMELANLSNRQAMTMAEAAALANLDMANLNNRQQAAVQNAQNFLQVDMANLSNAQQMEMFKAQQRVQSLFTDQAALNAAQQFNATSQNQVDQFFASLQSQTSQFNAAQSNAQAQFNAGQVNTIERFNAEINNQRDQFNASNRLLIDQANAQWRRQIATADTAAVNRANEINAQALLGYSQSAYNNLWQFYADNMEWAWTSAENERGRISNQAIAQLQADTSFDIAKFKADAESSSGFGNLIGKIFTSDLSNTIGGSILGDVFGIPTG